MSGSGITPINSGPLVIRTYLDSSSNNTYVLGRYDLPVSSNYVLITSSGGLLAPSDNIYVSSITVSSLIAPLTTASSVTTSNTYTSTIVASTATLTNIAFSTIIGSTLYGTTGIFNTTTPVSTVNTIGMSMSSLVGYDGNTAIVNNLLVNNQLGSVITNIAHLGNVSYTNVFATDAITASSMSSVAISTASLSTFGLNAKVMTVNTITGISSLLVTGLSYVGGSGSTLTAKGVTVNSTLTGSTINATTLSFSSLIGSTLTNTVSVNYATIKSTLTVSTATTNTTNNTVAIGSTLNANQLYATTGNYSTLQGSTLTISTLTASTLFASTLFASTSAVSTQAMSSITGSTLFISTMAGSTLTTTIFSTLLGTYSTLTGNTLILSTGTASSIFISTVIGSTLSVSTLFVSTVTGSTATISTITSQQLAVSTLIGSTMSQTNTNISTFIGSSIYASSVIASTVIVSSVTVGTIDGFTFGLGGGSQISNTQVGYYSLPVNTTGINNTSFGYTSLYSNTTGSNNTAFGVQSLFSNTTGSYNTAIGCNAGYIAGNQTGSYNTYIGFNAMPSTLTATNEIVVGGSYSSNYANTGIGSNTVTIGNPATVKNRIYGNVAIGSNTAGSALTVNGSYQQVGGSMAVYNTAYGYAQWWLFNDSIYGCGMFLNTSVRGAVDGGNYTGTFRNDYGSIRFQASGGYNNANGLTILASGYVGVGSATPLTTLDVTGGIRCSVDGSTTNIEGSNTAIAAYSPAALSGSASVWMGYDPTNNCGYINCARAGYIRPVCIQTRGGSVGVGGATDSAYTLDVKGTGHFTGALTIGGSLTCGTINVSNGSPWTGTTSLSYGYSTTVTATFTATTYSGLPSVDNSGTQGVVQAGPSISISNGYMSINPPFYQASLVNTGLLLTTGVAYTIGLSVNPQWNITTTNITVVGTNATQTVNSVSVTYAGYYLVTLTGYSAPTGSWAIITLYRASSTNQSLSSATAIARTDTCNNGNCGTSLSAVVYMTTSNYLFLTTTASGGYGMNFTVQWLSN